MSFLNFWNSRSPLYGVKAISLFAGVYMKNAGIQLSPGDGDLSLGALPDLQWVPFAIY